jgi:hypothetical protein
LALVALELGPLNHVRLATSPLAGFYLIMAEAAMRNKESKYEIFSF